MSATWYARPTCRLCNAPVELALALKPSPLANNYTAKPEPQDTYPLDLMRCTRCGHVQLGVVVDPAVLYSDYRYKSGVSQSFTVHLKDMARSLSAIRKGFVLEIASNDGTLLKAFESLGHKTIGVDPAGTYNCLPVFFSEEVAHNFRIPFEIVVANNVLAHVDDLRGVIRGVRHVLAEHGIFVFEVQYLKDLIDGNRFDLIYHEHLDYHHLAPLKPFLASEGLHIFHYERNDSQGGSIRVFCSKQPANIEIPDEGIDLSTLTIPENPVEGLEGVVAAYGACAKTTGLICQTGAKFDVLYDDTPEKHGLYAPTGQRIVTPDEAPSDHVYIAAWNFANEIKAKHPELRYV